MEFSASTIAQLVNGTVEGNPETTISTFAKIEEGHPGAISFLANPKYNHHLYTTQSSIVLVANDFILEHPVQATLIRVADPYATLSQLMTMADALINTHPTGVEQPSFVDSTVQLPEGVYIGAFAYIGRNVKLGQNVRIYPQAYVGHDVTVGNDTVVYPGAKIYHGTKIGSHCILHAGCVIGADGFGFAPMADGTYQKIPQLGHVEIADRVEIGANTTVDRATMGATRIGHGTKLDNLIQIAHNVTVGTDTVIAAQTGVAGSAHIGNNCMFAGQVGVAGHITVGNNTVVGAQTGVPNNVPDNSRIMGYPAIPAGQFARQAAMLRRLADLFKDVEQLKKEK